MGEKVKLSADQYATALYTFVGVFEQQKLDVLKCAQNVAAFDSLKDSSGLSRRVQAKFGSSAKDVQSLRREYAQRSVETLKDILEILNQTVSMLNEALSYMEKGVEDE